MARSVSDESSWDVVDDLPLRWATDFVPLASPGSRLIGASVIGYATWSDENRRGTGGQLLAIATKNNILLYETPKGERAYRFVKVEKLLFWSIRLAYVFLNRNSILLYNLAI